MHRAGPVSIPPHRRPPAITHTPAAHPQCTSKLEEPDILAYFAIGASNDPVAAINGRFERLHGVALGFRKLTNYTWPFLLHSGRLHTSVNAL